MLVPDITYGFTTPTDTAGPTFEILSRQESISASLTLIEIFVSNIPKDRILVLSNVTCRSNPGATQAVNQLAVQGVTQAGLIFDIDSRHINGVADENVDLAWQGQVFIQGGGDGRDSVRVFAAFNSGTNANQFQAGIHGVIIPHGNAGAF